MIDMNKLSFSIIQTNDGPTVITFVDGVELLHKDWNIGLSVCDFFHTTNLMHAGKSVLGICSCGCEGCDDYTIDIKIQGNKVTWEGCVIRTDDEQERKLVSYHFNKAEYMSAIYVFMHKCSDYLDRENKGSIDYTFNRLRSDFESDLKDFCPPIRDDLRASSSNLIARFVMNYKCFASYNSKMVNWWTQIPIRIRERKEYIEGLIIDKARKTLYFIETRKECENPKSYMDFNSMIEDVRDIIYPGSGDFYGLNLYEYDSYIVYLTDEMYVIQRLFNSFEYKSHLSGVQLNKRDKFSPQAYLAYADDIGFETALALANSVI